YRRARYLWPHRSIIEEGALAPLHHRFRIKIVAAGELLDRSLRSLYSSSDGVRGLGAAVKNLSHRASRNVASAWLIPRHSGTAHLIQTVENITKKALLLSRAEAPRRGGASRTFPAELSDFRRVCVGNRQILLQRKF